MHTKSYSLLFAAVVWGFLFSASAQTYIPGQTYYGVNNYIEYQPGSLPLIIAAPHGGTLMPAAIPDRNCTNCVYVMDAFTEELAREMADAIEMHTGCRPHLIINRLHRRKLDANRDLVEAADGNSLAESAWFDFHRFIKAAKDSSAARFGRGLFIDLHGHGHSVQRIELGYLLYGSELRMSDSVLNTPTFLNYSSIRGLALNNLNDFTHAQLLRGAQSLGSIFEDYAYPAVPSAPDPFPAVGQDYFSGGYNTERHGSISGGPIDAIQMECNYNGVRNTPANRVAFAQAAAETFEAYLQTHYFGSNFPGNNCQAATGIPLVEGVQMLCSPNPASDILNISLPFEAEAHQLKLYDAFGRVLACPVSLTESRLSIDVSALPPGWYVFQIRWGIQVAQGKFLKR